MNPSRLAKIKALADDERGHPEVRQRAREKLEAVRKSHPDLFSEAPKWRDVPPVDPRVHGMRRDPAYEYYVFTDLSLWDETKSGHKAHSVFHNGVNYRIVLFPHKKTPTWGWMRMDSRFGNAVFSGRFATVGEAHGDAWANLMAL